MKNSLTLNQYNSLVFLDGYKSIKIQCSLCANDIHRSESSLRAVKGAKTGDSAPVEGKKAYYGNII